MEHQCCFDLSFIIELTCLLYSFFYVLLSVKITNYVNKSIVLADIQYNKLVYVAQQSEHLLNTYSLN